MNRPMQRTLVFILLLFLAFDSSAQYDDKIRSGRPGFQIGPYTVGKGILQNQSGYYYSVREIEAGNLEKSDAQRFISVFRFGILERLELGTALSYKYTSNHFRADPNSSFNQEFDFFTMAIRGDIYQGKGLVPAVGAQLNADFDLEKSASDPTARLTLITAQSHAGFRFITNWVFSKNTSYIVFLDYGLSQKWRVFVEYLGWLRNATPRPKIDAGFLYLVNNNVQLDIQGGYGPQNYGETDYFITAGIGWRINPRLPKAAEKGQ